jgi:hypothetical protein
MTAEGKICSSAAIFFTAAIFSTFKGVRLEKLGILRRLELFGFGHELRP